ncbi:MAG: hypothetical protein Q7U55_02845, partial [Deltaproteobacteria bacterium]|nr:hypothetical protein [Deltaproteobacteria bacterium]
CAIDNLTQIERFFPLNVVATFRLRDFLDCGSHPMGDFLTQAKACGYRSLSKESLNLGDRFFIHTNTITIHYH